MFSLLDLITSGHLEKQHSLENTPLFESYESFYVIESRTPIETGVLTLKTYFVKF